MSDDTKRINLIDIEPRTHSWLVKQANEMGMSIRGYAGYLLDNVCVSWKPPTEGERERMILWQYHKALVEETLRDLVYRTAAIYSKYPTEELAETLASQCELAGLDYGEVIHRIEDDPYSSLVAFSHNGTKLGECIEWLSSILTGKEVGLPASAILTMGEQRNFSHATLNRAKRAMSRDKDSPKVISVRCSTGWLWKLEDRQNNE